MVDQENPTTRPYVATSSKSTVDIAIVRNPTKISRITVLDEPNVDPLSCITDQTKVDIPITKSHTPYNCTKADWKTFRNHLHDKISIDSNLSTTDDTNCSLETLKTQIKEALKCCADGITIPPPNNDLPIHIKDVIKTRNNTCRLH